MSGASRDSTAGETQITLECVSCEAKKRAGVEGRTARKDTEEAIISVSYSQTVSRSAMFLQKACVGDLRGAQQLLRPLARRALASSPPLTGETKAAEEEEFRTLELTKKKIEKRFQRTRKTQNTLPPRYKQQKIDQDWGSVWPAARSFHPATVPFPVRQGYPASNQPTPDKWGNAELMKIPNFLHLTPPVIQRQCQALKKFCTPWPAGLETVTKQEKHFPVTISKSSYLHSSPSIRDDKARIVTLKVSLKSLELDEHGKDKMLRLVGERYDPATEVLTLVADRCPLSQQNLDYLHYVLTVLYNESMKVEPWEHEKEVVDRERYIWEDSPSRAAAEVVAAARGIDADGEVMKEYGEAVAEIHNEGEDEATLKKYRESVVRLLGLDEPHGTTDAQPITQGQAC